MNISSKNTCIEMCRKQIEYEKIMYRYINTNVYRCVEVCRDVPDC